jgi:hypothetical protein
MMVRSAGEKLRSRSVSLFLRRRVYKRIELLDIVADRLKVGQHLCDIAVSQFSVMVMTAATDSEIGNVCGYHQSKFDAVA